MSALNDIRALEICHEQGTEEWMACRTNMFTASDIASILGLGRGSFKQVVKRKLGLLGDTYGGSSWILDRGILFEDVALHKFARRENKQIERFGLLRHPTIPWLGGSPDGITTDGLLLEVKCPTTREIKHEIPDIYIPQVQILLEITGLERAAFIQYRPARDQEVYPSNSGFHISHSEQEVLDVLYIDRDRKWFEAWFPILERKYKEYEAEKEKHRCNGTLPPQRTYTKRRLGWDLYYDEETDNVVKIRPVCTLLTNDLVTPF